MKKQKVTIKHRFRGKFISRILAHCMLLLLVVALSSSPQPLLADAVLEDTSLNEKLSIGTGWTVTKRHIVTNYHVVANTVNLRIVTPDRSEIPVKVIIRDPANDLAILEVMTAENLPTRPLPISLKPARLGTRVYTIGYPHPELLGMNPKLTTGHINAMSGLADDQRTYQISVPVQSGNSGGPLLNMNGEVVAIVTSKLNATKMVEWTGDMPQNINYAVKIKYLNRLLPDLPGNDQIRIGGHEKEQSLEVLAADAVDSIVIVIGDNLIESDASQNRDLIIDYPTASSLTPTTSTILIYSYAEPGNYDVNEDVEGSKTIARFSKNTAELIQMHLQSTVPGELEILNYPGRDSRKVYYRLEKEQYRKNICSHNEADTIIASYSEDDSGQGAHFRYVSFRIVDCQTLRTYSKQYTISRDEINDQFGYETALHISFRDFLFVMPPYIKWSRH